MGIVDRLRRWAGWFCLGLVAVFVLMGYYFGNIRFAPIAGGFLILSAVFLIEREQQSIGTTNAIHPGTDSGIGRAGRR
jgi:hypothetical protein